MTSSETPPPRRSRRMLWLIVFVVVLFGGYSAAWFYAGNLLEKQVGVALAEANRNGFSADCANPVARGFPFRIGLYCDTVSFDDRKGVSVSGGALRSAAQIYNPYRIVAELDGPAAVTLPRNEVLELNWSSLHGSVRLDSPLPERVSIEGIGLVAGPASAPPQLNAKTFEAHMQPNAQDLDVALSFGDLMFDAALLDGRVLPPLTGELDATVNDGVALLQAGLENLRGKSATVRLLSLSTGEKTSVTVSGTIAADEAGLLDADLKIAVSDPKALADVASKAFPEASDQIGNAMVGISMLGENASLPLKIVGGKASIGFIPLGDIPPL